MLQSSGLAREHGITQPRVAGPGRLVGHIEEERGLFDIVGSSLEFEDRGTHELEGVADPWKVHRLVGS